jgi:hypothetical protein
MIYFFMIRQTIITGRFAIGHRSYRRPLHFKMKEARRSWEPLYLSVASFSLSDADSRGLSALFIFFDAESDALQL